MNHKVNKLKLYSFNLIKINEEILKTRKICDITDLFVNIDDYDHFNFQFKFKKEYNYLNFAEKIICHQEKYINNEMKWHIDDAQIITHKKDKEYKNQIKISEKKSIHYPLRKPIYSLIIYGSEYKKDFTGGVIEFSDGLKIKPEKNKCILFDSREAHCVHKIKSGVQKYILIKFYK